MHAKVTVGRIINNTNYMVELTELVPRDDNEEAAIERLIVLAESKLTEAANRYKPNGKLARLPE